MRFASRGDDHRVELTRKEFDSLPEYNITVPTGIELGKMWKTRAPTKPVAPGWYLCMYCRQTPRPRLEILSRRIEIVEEQ